MSRNLLSCFALAVFVVLAFGSEDQSGSTYSSSSSTESSSSGGGYSAPAQPQEVTVSLGESFSLGDFSYAIHKTQKKQFIGNQFVGERAPANATYLLVHYSIINNGNKTATVLTDDFKLLDAKGREFTTSSEGTTALMMSGSDQDFLLSELQPGIQKDGVTVFLVPNDAVAPGLQLIVPEKGFLGTGRVLVTLK